MRDPWHGDTMYMLRSKSVKNVSAYPLLIHVSAYPLHDQTALRLFLEKGWFLQLRIYVSTFEVAGYSAVSPQSK